MSVRDTLRLCKPQVATVLSPHGGPIFVRALSGAGRRLYSSIIEEQKANGGIKNSSLLALGICDEGGNLLYDWQNPADIAELDEIDGSFERDLLEKMLELSGLTAKAVEDAAKN